MTAQRTSERIEDAIDWCKREWDTKHMRHLHLTNAGKMEKLPAWQALQIRIAPLIAELHKAEAEELQTFKQRIADGEWWL